MVSESRRCQIQLTACFGINRNSQRRPKKTGDNSNKYRLKKIWDYFNTWEECVWNFLIENSKFAIPFCSRYLPKVIYKLRLNTWNTKYSQNVTRVCKNILSVKHILLECPITAELFQKNRYDFNACNNVRDILCNTDVINCIIKLIVHSPVGKLV